MDAAAKIRERALLLGFDAVGFALPSEIGKAGRELIEFIALGRHGDMKWMSEKLSLRADPKTLWSEVRSVVMVATNYGPAVDPLENILDTSPGNISVYARNRDYHKILKSRLKQLGDWISLSLGGKIKVFVDTAPVMEKPLAQAAGLGWQGKHTNLVSKAYGSWLF
mgnify:FL=1